MNMKKTVLFLFIIIIAQSLAFADVMSVSMCATGGYSTISNTPSGGVNISEQYLIDINDTVYLGQNAFISLNCQIHSKDFSIDAGIGFGPALGIAFNPSNFMTLTIGPAFYIEGKNANGANGFGMAIDLNHTFFVGTYKNLGITIGTTEYLAFCNIKIDRNTVEPFFGLDTLFYVGFTYRIGNYPLE